MPKYRILTRDFSCADPKKQFSIIGAKGTNAGEVWDKIVLMELNSDSQCWVLNAKEYKALKGAVNGVS